MGILKFFEKSQLQSLQRALVVLPRKDKLKVLILGTTQTLVGLLDLVALGLVAVIGSLTIRGVQSSSPGDRTTELLAFLGLSERNIQIQIATLGICTAALFLVRTFMSVYLTRKILFYLSARSAEISKGLISNLLQGTLLDVQKFSRQENIYILTTGVNLVTIGLIGSTISLIVDGCLLLFLGIGLIIVDSTVAIFSFLIFFITAIGLLKALHKKASKVGAIEARMNIRSNELIAEVLESFREVTARNTREEYVEEIGDLRLNMGDAHAELTFMPNVGKYVIEAVIILGTLSLAAFEFLTKSSALAAASLSVFLAAGSRIAPTLLRIQQNILAVKSSSSAAITTLDLLEKYSSQPIQKEMRFKKVHRPHGEFSQELIIQGVGFKYPESFTHALRNINLCIKPGELIALVGPSGAGKSTLVDLILGALLPEAGEIIISGETPRNAIRYWPGLIAYVPQQVFISSGSVRENLLLGLSKQDFPDEALWSVLDAVELIELIMSLPNKLDSRIGDGGSRISGGQRQRIGIARALLTDPQIIVLDEATSSLDAETEETISRNIQTMKGHATVIVVAHRLSTVRNADKVAYLDAGSIRALGTFDEVRRQIPDFDKQATLMGL